MKEKESATHTSVLLHEAIESLLLTKGKSVLDGTFGAGGHSRAIAKMISQTGHLIAFDADASVFNAQTVRELEALTQFTYMTENFRHAGERLPEIGINRLDAALFDLGLSSTQLEHSGRGFSFQRDEPLRMTFKENPNEGEVTAEMIVNEWSEESLATILTGFGEERYARSIAKGIVEARKLGAIVRTGQLAEVIRNHTPSRYHHGRTHFATRTFQALRMAANDELGAIEAGIRGILPLLVSGGRVAVISFHSIEDRVVKHLFRELIDRGVLRSVTKKPILPSDEEIKKNPRARSAKLRVGEKV